MAKSIRQIEEALVNCAEQEERWYRKLKRALKALDKARSKGRRLSKQLDEARERRRALYRSAKQQPVEDGQG